MSVIWKNAEASRRQSNKWFSPATENPLNKNPFLSCMVSKFIKEVAYTFHPFRYQYLADKRFSSSLWFMARIIMIAIVLAALLSFPRMFAFKSGIQDELGKFSEFHISGNISATAPVNIPESKPMAVIDLVTANKTIGDETFLVTKDKISYRFFGLRDISISELKDVTANPAAVSRFLTILLLMFIPAFGFLLFSSLLIKYLLLVLLSSLAFFVLLELTHFRLKYKQMLSVTCHTATFAILLEVLSMPFSTAYLVPTIKFLGTYVYAIPLGIFFALTLVFIILTYFDRKRHK